MLNIKELVDRFVDEGYSEKNAEARVCQDIILRAIAESSLSRNVTIKGGVVLRSKTGNSRRATQDMDIDFIRYSLSDESIDLFICRINCLEGINIVRIGEIEELSQQDYNGKRVFVKISDSYGTFIDNKIDIGVHKHLEIEQEEYCFDISFNEEGASLLINSQEQMYVEKLRSLLKFGIFSTRYKDIYDMYYYCDKVNLNKLQNCLETYILNDKGMREKSMKEIVKRIGFIFNNAEYKRRVDNSDKRWLDDSIDDIFDTIFLFLEMMSKRLIA